jgi:DNA-directed RNA polymerase subunit RPC12/RpoP
VIVGGHNLYPGTGAWVSHYICAQCSAVYKNASTGLTNHCPAVTGRETLVLGHELYSVFGTNAYACPRCAFRVPHATLRDYLDGLAPITTTCAALPVVPPPLPSMGMNTAPPSVPSTGVFGLPPFWTAPAAPGPVAPPHLLDFNTAFDVKDADAPGYPRCEGEACGVELDVKGMDAYYGKEPGLARLCIKCRTKAGRRFS